MTSTTPRVARALVAAAALLAAPLALADALLDWNATAADILTAAKLPTPQANRVMALAQAAVYEAVNEVTGRHPGQGSAGAARGASVDAAVAAATRASLSSLVPSQQPAIDEAYRKALALVPEGSGQAAGVAVGERAAAAVLKARGDDGSSAPDAYRPATSPGAYAPTVLPLLPHWGKRKPWFLSSGDQFRPGAPPDLASAVWARDYNEIRTLGAKIGSSRSAEQTAIARFWEATTPAVYLPLARAVAGEPGREVTENALLLATVSKAMDDALIAVFDAKYTYNFWRPVTAIRNGDRDGNDATEREPGWLPFIDTPMHPEYPCAHCILASAVGTILQAVAGDAPPVRLSSTSPTAPGVVRSWARVSDMVEEVSLARICDGVHYRNSTEVGIAMGRKIGNVAAATLRHASR